MEWMYKMGVDFIGCILCGLILFGVYKVGVELGVI